MALWSSGQSDVAEVMVPLFTTALEAVRRLARLQRRTAGPHGKNAQAEIIKNILQDIAKTYSKTEARALLTSTKKVASYELKRLANDPHKYRDLSDVPLFKGGNPARFFIYWYRFEIGEKLSHRDIRRHDPFLYKSLYTWCYRREMTLPEFVQRKCWDFKKTDNVLYPDFYKGIPKRLRAYEWQLEEEARLAETKRKRKQK